MSVGLSLLDWIEKHLQSQGLLPLEVADVHRVIDFPSKRFVLRWASEETRGHTVEVRLEQKLAQKTDLRPMIEWCVVLNEMSEYTRRGQVLLSSTIRPIALSELIGKVCEELILAVPKAGQTAEDSAKEIAAAAAAEEAALEEEMKALLSTEDNATPAPELDLDALIAAGSDDDESEPKAPRYEAPMIDDSDLSLEPEKE